MKKERSSSSHRFKYGDQPAEDKDLTLENLRAFSFSEEDLISWDYDFLKDEKLPAKQLSFVFAIFSSVLKDQNIADQAFLDFLLELKAAYQANKNPFHNFTHGISVLHGTFYLLKKSKIWESLSSYDLLLFLIAAIGHDANHRGFNNAFEVASKSDLAAKYQEDSVLEKHHAATTLDILVQNQLLGQQSEKQEEEVRNFVQQVILYTDMKYHGKVVEQLKKIQEEGKTLQQIFTEDKIFVLQSILHTSDLQNPAKPFHQASTWGRKISQEFSHQVESERELGLPVTKFMEGLDDFRTVMKAEIGFNKFVVSPLWTSMNAICGNQFSQQLTHLEENTQKYENSISYIQARTEQREEEDKVVA